MNILIKPFNSLIMNAVVRVEHFIKLFYFEMKLFSLSTTVELFQVVNELM